jgi:dethiobiotin synthase
MSGNQPKFRRIFVTGTDTGVGKTVLSALLCAALDATYWKPIQTGTDEGTDRRTVMEIAGIPESQTGEEAYLYAPPVSPHLAARWAGDKINLGLLREPRVPAGKMLVIEGIGGVMVPINDTEFVTHLIRLLDVPVLLASRSSLGTINHTLLSLKALRAANIEIIGVILIGEPNQDNREAIEQYGQVKVVGEIPRLPALNREALQEVFEKRFQREVFVA